MDGVEDVTHLWIRDESDHLAIENGCWFDVERAAFAVWWIEKYCKLYEGAHAGESVIMRSGCEDQLPFSLPITEKWKEGGREKSILRAKIYARWIASGKATPDWQYEVTMRLFGWAVFDRELGRKVRRNKYASVWISKKNKKTPTLAAWGVFLTCGDGEKGAHNFAGAKDGLQASISMEHAMAMVESSPMLNAECKTNKNEKSIYHVATRSRYKPISSSGENNQQSKEGLNGNLLIDETHVVDRAFVERVSRAGISRHQFLHIEVSTVGNNPDGYGKERQDYARQVQSGAVKDWRMLVAIYEAPQDVTDKQLDADPVKYGRMANPSWGHTIRESEFLEDYERSKRSITALALFKMYRLNIWQQTSRQWLRLYQWLDCGDSTLSIEDYFGQPAACGLDLSKTRDMSALSISIPTVGGKVQLFVRLWMTESYIDANADKATFRQWVANGELFQIPGDTIQEDFIRAEFERLTKQFVVRILVKDKAFAADFTEWCETKYPKIIQVDYPQNAQMMEKPIDDFEAAVIEGSLIHDNNLCLNWQAGHAAVQENARGFRIIRKPKRDDYRKVDGMVAAVMSHWGTKHLPKRSSVHSRRGVLTA